MRYGTNLGVFGRRKSTRPSANVPSLNTNTYVPGALADHLTSGGGDLFGSAVVDYGQMSILRWLEAGAIASYGAVTEPCARQQKFPQASVLVKNYFLGNTAVEAYLKSVQWPAQGVFVGDPLARPFGTNPRVFEHPEPIGDAWRQVCEWLACESAWSPQPTERHADLLGQFLGLPGVHGNLVPDAHLATLAMEHGLTLCSTDGDFARFRGLRWQNPLAQ